MALTMCNKIKDKLFKNSIKESEKKMYPKIKNAKSLTMIVDGVPYTASNSHRNYAELEDCFNEDLGETFVKLFNDSGITSYYVEKGNFNDVEVKEDGVYFQGNKANNYVCSTIVEMAKNGQSIDNLVKFFKRVMLNPSKRSAEQMFQFLENGNMPIDTDGFFIAYKGIRDDYYDRHSGTIDNSVGAEIPRMNRNEVCDDPKDGCSYGYHVGSLKYANNWSDRTVLVKVDPADVVCVPYHETEKMRCCFYEVIGEYERPLSEGVYISYQDESEDMSEEDNYYNEGDYFTCDNCGRDIDEGEDLCYYCDQEVED
jgi:hypothetical protein